MADEQISAAPQPMDEPIQVEPAQSTGGGQKKAVLILIVLVTLVVGLALGWLLKTWLTPEIPPVDTEAIRTQAIVETKALLEQEKMAQESAMNGVVKQIAADKIVIDSGDSIGVVFTIDNKTLFSKVSGDDGTTKTELSIDDVAVNDFVSIKSDAVIKTESENYAQEIYKL
ncbi:MAG: hypothetical protein COU09_01955 [Candidatus Harrisonbacteria bacterium CG10_big_fil_rev_8_21_14_0_10_44_23]|uniref:Uncharacterized protein n=1 Tax=Candidatus Harrisonbacteria bacterium CG10_big_fil_rev_8_21_14_0_10_44_23 TaxID=1974585 RepID=A0A2H0UQ43_9BACT|nr:MAG: hypothetical protein COU09_01955 [Candidatus Harrisonbacteria bacterium CG10_big_fil_rev_8_21_14_0_10_44_23]